MAIIGEWCSKGKTITISDRGGQLTLEMGPGAPALPVIRLAESGQEAWPMQWAAIRVSSPGGALDKKDAVYLLELSAPSSPKLLVRKPVGDSVIEFLRAGAFVENPGADTGSGVTTLAIHRSRSRSYSRSADGKEKGGVGNFLPGDWNCPRCGEHNFARNLSCRSCGASKPGAAPEPAAGQGGREGLVMKIKSGQRDSQSFKQRWWDYCDRFGRGFYDPARHEMRFLEDFLKTERGGSGSSRSSSESRSRSRSDSKPSSGKSRSRSRSRRRKRRKGKRARSRRKRTKGRKKRRARSRHRRGKKEKVRKKPRKRSRSRSKSSGDSGGSGSVSASNPQEAKEAKERQAREAHEAKAAAALKDAEAAVASAEEELQKELESAKPESAVFIRAVGEACNEEVLQRVELAKAEADENINAQLKELEAKFLDEKAVRLKEAEHKLDDAVASRLKEAEKRFKKEADVRFEEEKRLAEEAGRKAVEDAKKRALLTNTKKVKDAEARLQELRERLTSLRGEKPEKEKKVEKRRKKECSSSEAGKDDGSGESSSDSSAGSGSDDGSGDS